MIVAISRIQSRHGRRDDLLASLRPFLSALRAQPGCLDGELAVAIATPDVVQQYFDEDVLTLIERWEKLDLFLAHHDSPQYKNGSAALQPLIVHRETRVLRRATFAALVAIDDAGQTRRGYAEPTWRAEGRGDVRQ